MPLLRDIFCSLFLALPLPPPAFSLIFFVGFYCIPCFKTPLNNVTVKLLWFDAVRGGHGCCALINYIFKHLKRFFIIKKDC